MRKHLEKAKGKRKEEKATLINQQLNAMVESILNYIEFGEGDFD